MLTIIVLSLLIVAWLFFSLPHLYINERTLHRDINVFGFYKIDFTRLTPNLLRLGLELYCSFQFVHSLGRYAYHFILSTLGYSDYSTPPARAYVDYPSEHDDYCFRYCISPLARSNTVGWFARVLGWHESITILIMNSAFGVCLITLFLPLIFSSLFRLRRSLWRKISYNTHWSIYDANWRVIEANDPRLPFPYRPQEPLIEKIPWPAHPRLSTLSPFAMSVFYEYGPWDDPKQRRQALIRERERWKPATFDLLISGYPIDAETRALRNRCLDVYCFLSACCDAEKELDERLEAAPNPVIADPLAIKAAAELIARAVYMRIHVFYRAYCWLLQWLADSRRFLAIMTMAEEWSDPERRRLLGWKYRLICAVAYIIVGSSISAWKLGKLILRCTIQSVFGMGMWYVGVLTGAGVILQKLNDGWLWKPEHLRRWRSKEHKIYYTGRNSAQEWYNDEYLPSEQIRREFDAFLRQRRRRPGNTNSGNT